MDAVQPRLIAGADVRHGEVLVEHLRNDPMEHGFDVDGHDEVSQVLPALTCWLSGPGRVRFFAPALADSLPPRRHVHAAMERHQLSENLDTHGDTGIKGGISDGRKKP